MAAKAARPANARDLPTVLAEPVKGVNGGLVGCGPVTLHGLLVLNEARANGNTYNPVDAAGPAGATPDGMA